MTISKDRLGGFLLLVFCIVYAFLGQQIKLLPFQEAGAFTARTMPEVLSVLGIGLSLLVIVFPGNKERADFSGLNWKAGLAFLVLMSAYGFLVRPLGFIISTSAFLMIGFAMLGERSLAKLVLVAVPLVVIFWALMTLGLSVFIEPLPFFMKDWFNA